MFEYEKVELKNSLVFFQFYVDDPEIIDWVSKISEDIRINAVKKALKIGVTAMTSALVGSTTFTLQQALERWKVEVENALSESREKIVQTITNNLSPQVIQPVKEKIEEATRNAGDRIKEYIDNLEKRIDPNNPGSWLNIIQETINVIRQEFDPERENSYLWKVRNTLFSFYEVDGEAAQCIKEVFRQAFEPLRSTIEAIDENIIRIMERLGGIVPQKGLAFESAAVADLLYKATSITGDLCEHVGKDNRPGDWLINVYYGSIADRQQIGKIVIEAKDTTIENRKKVDEVLNKAMQQRSADIGILVLARPEQNPYGLSFVVLDDTCSKLVCVWDEQGLNFNFAYQLARLQIIENYLRSTAKLDLGNLRNQIQEIINETNQIDEIIHKASLAKDRAEEAENLSKRVKRNLIQKLKDLERDIVSAIEE
jgi:hypothetical protein